MTPRQFSLMAERHQRRMKQEDRRAGGILAMLYNINRDSRMDPEGKDWDDFFTEWKAKPGEQTEEEMLQVMKAFATAHNEGLVA